MILITGGTGSLGQAFCKEALTHNPKAIRVFSMGEHRQVEMERAFSDPRLRFLIGDIRDKDRLVRAMHGVDLVVHAAALKHVHVVEYNVQEGLATNVIGSNNVVEAAIDTDVPKTILISTDKSAHPNLTYGMQKAVAERLFILGNSYGHSRFACTRYGNVAFSQGSFSAYLRDSKGPVSVTHPDMTRFWISIPEAVQFVISALTDMTGGEVFVPKLPSFTVANLIAALRPDAYVTVSGIRPGEKLHETLVTSDESRHTIDQGKRYVILPEFRSWTESPLPQGRALENGFSYMSNNNSWWLSPKDIEGLASNL